MERPSVAEKRGIESTRSAKIARCLTRDNDDLNLLLDGELDSASVALMVDRLGDSKSDSMIERVSRLVLSPDRRNAMVDRAKDLFLAFSPLLQEFFKVSHPHVSSVVPWAFVVGGWVFNRWKFDRAADALRVVAERVVLIESKYAQKEEFGDLLEFYLRKAVEQPDDGRRERIKSVMFKILESPREHETNKRLIRLAAEIRDDDRKVLEAIWHISDDEEASVRWKAVREATGFNTTGIHWSVERLKTEGLVHGEAIWGVLRPGQDPKGTTRFFLTDFGRELLWFM